MVERGEPYRTSRLGSYSSVLRAIYTFTDFPPQVDDHRDDDPPGLPALRCDAHKMLRVASLLLLALAVLDGFGCLACAARARRQLAAGQQHLSWQRLKSDYAGGQRLPPTLPKGGGACTSAAQCQLNGVCTSSSTHSPRRSREPSTPAIVRPARGEQQRPGLDSTERQPQPQRANISKFPACAARINRQPAHPSRR